MLMRRRRCLRYNNSVFEDVTSCAPRAQAIRSYARFSWIIYSTDLPTGRFYIYNPACTSLSLSFVFSFSLSPAIRHMQFASGRRTGVSYRWPINAGVWKHDIYPRIPAGSLGRESISRTPARSGVRPRRSFFSAPFSRPREARAAPR